MYPLLGVDTLYGYTCQSIRKLGVMASEQLTQWRLAEFTQGVHNNSICISLRTIFLDIVKYSTLTCF